MQLAFSNGQQTDLLSTEGVSGSDVPLEVLAVDSEIHIKRFSLLIKEKTYFLGIRLYNEEEDSILTPVLDETWS